MDGENLIGSPPYPPVSEWRMIVKENRALQKNQLSMAKRISDLEIENMRLKSIIGPWSSVPAPVKDRSQARQFIAAARSLAESE